MTSNINKIYIEVADIFLIKSTLATCGGISLSTIKAYKYIIITAHTVFCNFVVVLMIYLKIVTFMPIDLNPIGFVTIGLIPIGFSPIGHVCAPSCLERMSFYNKTTRF